MHYLDKQESLVKIMEGLKFRGWKIYGFKKDQSDSMTDYYSPASWRGIAVKNGYILVVDNCSNGEIGGDFIKKSYDHKIINKITKLKTLVACPNASKGEKENAQNILEGLNRKVLIKEVVTSNLPKINYQANPNGAKWHIEKNGEIIAKGNGVYGFSRINTQKSTYYNLSSEVKTRTLNEVYLYNTTWEQFKRRELKKRADIKKLSDKYFKLLDKWDSSATIKIGEGSEELIKTIVKKEIVYYTPETSTTPTKYIKLGEKWSRYGGLQKGFIYKLDSDLKGIKKLTRKFIYTDINKHDRRKSGAGFYSYKLEPRKNAKLSYYHENKDDFIKGNLIYIKFVKKIVIEETVKYIKQPVKKSKKTVIKKDIKTSKDSFLDLFWSGDISDFKHTKTKEILTVLKLKETLCKDTFKEFSKWVKDEGLGYYSRYAKGFIMA